LNFWPIQNVLLAKRTDNFEQKFRNDDVAYSVLVILSQCAEIEWQNLWGIKCAGTRSKEMEEVVVGVLISRRTSTMKKAPKDED